MILSQKMIEEIAVAVIRDFQKSFFGSEADDPARFALPTPIDQFASDYLNLKVSFQKLSSDRSMAFWSRRLLDRTRRAVMNWWPDTDGTEQVNWQKKSPCR